MKTTAIILQARTGSLRLPNKVLRPIQEISLLSHCIRRLKRVHESVSVIVATSTKEQDNTVVEIAEKEGVLCYQGSEGDVLDRYYRTAFHYDIDCIIRATADNPFVDVEEGRKLYHCLQTGEWDYVSMIEPVDGMGLPIGVGLEGFSRSALEKSWEDGTEWHHREHVNEYILENRVKFSVHSLACSPANSCPELRLTVDTEQDMAFVNTLLSRIRKPALTLTTARIVAWWKDNQRDFHSN